jgi:hypothetical protein
MINLSRLSLIMSLMSQPGPPAALVPRATPVIHPAHPQATELLPLPATDARPTTPTAHAIRCALPGPSARLMRIPLAAGLHGSGTPPDFGINPVRFASLTARALGLTPAPDTTTAPFRGVWSQGRLAQWRAVSLVRRAHHPLLSPGERDTVRAWKNALQPSPSSPCLSCC